MNPNLLYVMVFGDVASGRWLGLDEVMRVGSLDGTSTLWRRHTRGLALSSLVRAPRKGHVDTGEEALAEPNHAGILISGF